MLSQVMMNCWLGKSQKIPFHQQLQKMFTTRAGEKMILAMSTQISRSLKFIQYQTLIRLDMSTSSILLQVRCLMPLQSKQTYSLQSPSCSPINTSRKLIKIFLGLFSNGAAEVTFTKIALEDLYDILSCLVCYQKKQI